ncbi:PilC/PilY family type IV pilus protein [Dokdonella sp.]|uniref:pilus assembly protein n=1 Tax=Dokdonella sp. TaxID=2291710 RepID=UPI001B007963|nr:PilC/PilY family type IV pilus protein [Dokdonella sp.]MBO9662415.1 hypothetical protein [Dokdonella sp.]
MTRMRSSFTLSLATAVLCVLTGLPQFASAQAAAEGTIDLLTTPPELTSKVAPNVVLTFDDSGSMGRNYMPDQRPYTGASWGGTDQQNTAGSAIYSGSDSSPYLCAGAIDPRVTDATNPKSWAMNGVYYNPNVKYDPPLKADGTAFPNSVFTSAWDNGILANRPDSPTSSTRRNLGVTADGRFCGKLTAGYYRLKDTVTLTLGTDGKISNTGTLYTASNWQWVSLPVAEQQNFANWYSYYHTRYTASVTAVSRAFSTFDRNIRVAWQNINTRQLAAATGIFPFENVSGAQTRTNFYTWLFSTTVGGNTPNQTAADRVGTFFQRDTGASDTNPYWERSLGKELSCRKNFHIQMTDGLWNNSVVTVTQTDNAEATLPDGRAYSTSADTSKIFWNELSNGQKTMADIAFHYWATDLRPGFKNNEQTKLKVRPYLADRTTGVTGSTPLTAGDNWLDNLELYWNPANDPATWPHLVQFMIGFGVDGTIRKTADNYLKLRKGGLQWPKLQGNSPYSDTAEKIDDMWHAAINSRGEFFAASNPSELIQALQKIIASVVAQSTSSTPASVSLPILTGGNSGYKGGYDSSSWSGTFLRYELDAAGTPATVKWDAGCLLTGGLCADPAGTNTTRDPNDRIIVTSNGTGTGVPFRWTSLSAGQQNALNQKPGAAAACTGGTSPNCDGYGSIRLDYLRGKRTNESATATPSLRVRASVLGAVVNGEPAYVSSPRSGYHDMFPTGSPEVEAGAEGSYASYQNQQRSRRPMTYVGANDGMLHAFDAETGAEAWAYVPNLLLQNGRLAKSTVRDAGLTPGVDSRPREADVFVNGKWRTILLGSLRLGGRGIYVLDVTNPTMGDESSAAGSGGVPMWEFTSGTVPSADGDQPCAVGSRSCASLGYTYDSANVARLHYQNKWVAVVSSGYFPSNADAAAAPGDRTEAAAKRTSLLVIDLETGKLIREIPTSGAPQSRPAGFKTFGLSTPMVYDLGSDEVDDIVYAGDLAGNLWRFDLSSDQLDDWKVDLMFTSYGNGGAETVGDQPFVFNPTALRDPATRRPILVIGTGKYLGSDDRTSSIPEQAFYGIRDYGPESPAYPIKVSQLVTQNMTQDATNTRRITGFEKPTEVVSDVPPMRLAGVDPDTQAPTIISVMAHGWRIRLDVDTEKGERAQRRALPFATGNIALLYGLIPKSDDPCDPGARYSIMAVDGGTGAAITTSGGNGNGQGIIGTVANLPSPPSDAMVARGGGKLIIPGLTPQLTEDVRKAMDKAVPPWHRGAWRELLGW